MPEPNPQLEPNGPLEVVEGRTLFRTESVTKRKGGSLARLDGGRLLLAFGRSTDPTGLHDGVVMLSRSNDDGASWEEPAVVYHNEGWQCISMGGLVRFSDEWVRLIVGGIKIDESLGGDEPFTDLYVTAIDSTDGGDSWSRPGPEIRLFPHWTEMYGASNPHRLSDGRYILAAMGTMGRDEGWHSGVVFSDAEGRDFSEPVVIAQSPGRNFSDIDLVRLVDGRFLAVIREHVTRQSFYAHSADEGRTWTEIRPTGFTGANIKLVRLRSGGVICAYRNEDPQQRGVSCSVTEDGGENWRHIGQLYVPDPGAVHRPNFLCGYPDMVYTGDREIACVLHTFADAEGQIDLHFLRLRDRS